MSEQKDHVLQICIICLLVFLLGLKILLRRPEWFDGEGYNDKLHAHLGHDSVRPTSAQRFITLGSATSTEDSGFFNYILPMFQAATGLGIHVQAVGSDQALAMGAQGDVDAVLVQNMVRENSLMASGSVIDRRDVMYNDFVVVGPSSDPAGIRGLRDALTAFALIAAKKAQFVSRGDGGGTYAMERRLWRSAGIEPVGKTWYRSLNEGVGATLDFAATVDAYTLTDRATWMNSKNRQNLEILTEGDPVLFNLYSSILVNPAKWPQVKINDAKTWHLWLTSNAGLAAIESYRIDGKELFFPPRSRS